MPEKIVRINQLGSFDIKIFDILRGDGEIIVLAFVE